MKLTDRLAAAWRALTGQRSDPYAGTYGSSGAGYAGGAVNRLTASLASWSGSINADLDGALPILRARARSLAANNEHGRRFLSLVAANVVGRNNPKLQVRAMTPGGRLDKAANDAIEVHFDRWGRRADISGRCKSLPELMRLAVRGVARDGEALIRKVRDRNLPYGLGLQLLESDRLDDTLNARLTNGNVIRQGVEIDGALRAIAYYVKTAHPGESGFVPGRPGIERVPAGEMFHLFLPDRAEQVRGVTWMHAVIVRGAVIHRFEEAAVIAAEIGASKVAALERAEEAADVAATLADSTVGNALQMNVQAGEMFELPPGYKLNSWNPEYPHANFESFLKACLRGLAAGLDVAAHNLTGDMTDVNYSSARIAELAEREMWMTLQEWFIGNFCQPLYEEWLAMALLLGQITFPSGSKLPADKFDKFLNASRFQGRRWAWVDPVNEADAQEKLLANKLTSRTRIAAEQGEEFDDILDELKAEAELIKAAGLAAPEPAAPAPSPAEKAVELMAAQMAIRAAEPPAVAPAPTFSVPVTVALDADHLRDAGARLHDTLAEQGRELAQQIREDIAAMPIIIPAPVVHVAAPNVTVENNVEAPAVTLEATIQPAEVTISLPPRRTDTEVTYNNVGDIAHLVQIEKDV